MTAAPSVRAPRRRVDGVLLLDKPLGLSSNAALQRAKRLYRAPRRPATPARSTRSPPACCRCAFGDATKFAQSLLDARKALPRDGPVRHGDDDRRRRGRRRARSAR